MCLISVNVYKAATHTIGAPELKQWSEKGHKARASALQNRNPYAGFMTATHARRTNVLMIPRMHSTDDKDLILGTKSNNAMTPEARVMEPSALQSFIGIATKEGFPEGSKVHPTPLDLEHDDLKEFYPVPEGQSADGLYGKLCVGRVSCSLPVFSGSETVLTGRLEDQTVEEYIHETYGAYGDKWLRLILTYKQNVVDAILNSPDLRANHVPATEKVHQYKWTTPFHKQQAPDTDDDDMVEAELKLKADCEEIVAKCADTPRGMHITIDEDTTTAPVPEKPELVDTSYTTSGVTARRAAEKAQQRAGVLIFFAVEDDNGKLQPPTVTRLGELVLDSSTKSEAMEIFANGYQTLTSKMKTSRDYLTRAANPPSFRVSPRPTCPAPSSTPGRCSPYPRASSRVSLSSNSFLTLQRLLTRRAGISTRQWLRLPWMKHLRSALRWTPPTLL